MSLDARAGVYVVIPAYNEEKVVRETVQRVAMLPVQVVVVDDCSTDGTLAQLHGLRAAVLRHAVNLGQGAALQTGIDFSLQLGARYVVTFDADGQHDEADILRLVDVLVSGDFDVVLGSRFLGQVIGISPARRLLLAAAVRYTRFTTKLRLTDAHNGLRAFRASAAPGLRITHNRMAHASEILQNIRRAKLSYTEAPCVVRYSAYSKTKGQSGLGAIDILYDLIIGRLTR